jgi:hypothetical protein
MTRSFPLSLMALRRWCTPVVWVFVLLVLAVFVERRVAESDFDDDNGVVVQNDEAVEGEEILTKLLLANDVVIPILPAATAFRGERPVLLTATEISLLAVRGLESRAPPAPRFSA